MTIKLSKATEVVKAFRAVTEEEVKRVGHMTPPAEPTAMIAVLLQDHTAITCLHNVMIAEAEAHIEALETQLAEATKGPSEGRWYSPQTMDAVVREREELRAARDSLGGKLKEVTNERDKAYASHATLRAKAEAWDELTNWMHWGDHTGSDESETTRRTTLHHVRRIIREYQAATSESDDSQ